jgi:hypothetical protein
MSHRVATKSLSGAALLAVNILERLSVHELAHPVDQLFALDLHVVERRPLEEPVALAGRRVAVHNHPGGLALRLEPELVLG